jgi:hypothetical protein
MAYRSGSAFACLQHIIIARGADGYGVAIAIGEIAPKIRRQAGDCGLPERRRNIAQSASGHSWRCHAGRDVRDFIELLLR